MDGLSLIRELIKLDPAANIYAISGGREIFSDTDYLYHAKQFGAIKTFRKPFDNTELIRAIHVQFK
ncbi:MAG: hypothetical protein OEY59_06720 [Deltaproteobacteria bacterium]|nr:hypothetical protein [Deltaproteobacteria bacterium]